jgi:hypothetical protein
VCRIESAYKDAETALREVGRLLRTTYAGKFMWASDHKIAVSGIRIALESMRRRLPRYEKPNAEVRHGAKDADSMRKRRRRSNPSSG